MTVVASKNWNGKHLQKHHNDITLQASQAEVGTTTSPITGLPASVSSLNRQPLRLRQPGPADLPSGAARSHSGRKYNKAVPGHDAKMRGHSCFTTWCLMGKIPGRMSTLQKLSPSMTLACQRKLHWLRNHPCTPCFMCSVIPELCPHCPVACSGIHYLIQS